MMINQRPSWAGIAVQNADGEIVSFELDFPYVTLDIRYEYQDGVRGPRKYLTVTVEGEAREWAGVPRRPGQITPGTREIES